MTGTISHNIQRQINMQNKHKKKKSINKKKIKFTEFIKTH